MLYHFLTGSILEGPNPYLSGDCTYLSGDCTGVTGDCTGIVGDVSNLYCNLDLACLTGAERLLGINIITVVSRVTDRIAQLKPAHLTVEEFIKFL